LKQPSAQGASEKPIPPCECCGSARVFEFQLLPSLLHVLDVDGGLPAAGGGGGIEALYAEGGMNWGNIAVYACPSMACEAQQEYAVVQASVEGQPSLQPSRPPMSCEPVVIAEGTDFNSDVDEAEQDEEDEEVVIDED